MFEKIVYISDKGCHVRLTDYENLSINLMNLHLIFEDDKKKILGEVDDVDQSLVKVRFLGEIVENRVVSGTIRKPSLDAKVRIIDASEVPMVTGQDTDGFMKLGASPFYDGHTVFLDVNNFFSNHFAIFGNTGSGKSCGVTRVFQNLFHDQRLTPTKANILMFDSSGEYYNAFSNLNSINSEYNYKFITTNETEGVGEKLRLPIYLLNASDLALLLQATSHSQLPIIERMLKLALIFSQDDMDATNYKNHLVAKAIMTILYTNETSPNKRNEIFSILASCSTPQFNLEAPVQGIGYTRKFRECFLIDNKGQFSESVLLTDYVTSFIDEKYDDFEPKGGVFYNLDTLEKALNFTLISEGWLRNENTYGDAVTLKVRLHALIVGPTAKFFDVPNFVSLEEHLSSLILSNGKKYQFININLDDVDDDFAKVITKIYSRLIFEFCKGLKNRGSIPFHIVVEEAHRYIQNDTDRFLIGYNIFERIAKEGRKYGVILGLISQRPVELSDTVISQCSNFLIFKMNHPVDVEYIRKMVPNISDEIVEKQKTLQAGTCLGFGLGFRIPLIVKMEMPNPAPWSGNSNVASIWRGGSIGNTRVNNSVEENGGIKKPTIETQVMDKPVEVNNQEQVLPISSFNNNQGSNTNNLVNLNIPTVNSNVSLTNSSSLQNNIDKAVINSDNSFKTDSGIPLLNIVDSSQTMPVIINQSNEVKEEKTPNMNSFEGVLDISDFNNSVDVSNSLVEETKIVENNLVNNSFVDLNTTSVDSLNLSFNNNGDDDNGFDPVDFS